MSLNIKNPEAHPLATKLAELTGESLTTAVVVALRERLQAEERRHARGEMAERMLRLADRFKAGMRPGCKSEDHGDLLSGEGRLPQ